MYVPPVIFFIFFWKMCTQPIPHTVRTCVKSVLALYLVYNCMLVLLRIFIPAPSYSQFVCACGSAGVTAKYKGGGQGGREGKGGGEGVDQQGC